MIKNDMKINAIAYGDIVEKIALDRKIDISEAREIVANLSFNEYVAIIEDSTSITPPSGNPLGPTSPGQQSTTGQSPSQIKSIWPGKGAPVEVGMTVGLKGPNGVPVPGQVSQVDMAAKGVKVKNPTTGQDEWANMDNLQPFMAQGGANQATPGASQPGGQTIQPGTGIQTTTEEEIGQLNRLRELAGMRENCSAGATGAGSIAVAPSAMGTMRKRQATDEELKKEYTPKEAPKTIVGDTKPGQASGELSANLAVRGKKTASRMNNGFKR